MWVRFFICLPRMDLGQGHCKPLLVLRKAEKGDFTDGILCIRKAGEAYAKNFAKDSPVGLKNPIRRSRKPLQTEALVKDIGSELAKVSTEALSAYAFAASDLEDLGMKAQSLWIAENVTGGTNEMLTAGDKVFQTLEAVHQTLGLIDARLSAVSKGEQAAARKSRMDSKKIPKIFEAADIPAYWRHALYDAGLSIDSENPHDPDKNFETYKASQLTFTDEVLGGTDNWDVPRWYAPDDTGPYVDLV